MIHFTDDSRWLVAICGVGTIPTQMRSAEEEEHARTVVTCPACRAILEIRALQRMAFDNLFPRAL